MSLPYLPLHKINNSHTTRYNNRQGKFFQSYSGSTAHSIQTWSSYGRAPLYMDAGVSFEYIDLSYVASTVTTNSNNVVTFRSLDPGGWRVRQDMVLNGLRRGTIEVSNYAEFLQGVLESVVADYIGASATPATLAAIVSSLQGALEALVDIGVLRGSSPLALLNEDSESINIRGLHIDGRTVEIDLTFNL